MRLFYFDDSGSRIPNKPEAPFFCLGGFGIDAEDVPELQKIVRETAKCYGLTLQYPSELKFQHVGTMRDSNPKKPHWMIRAGLTERNQRRALVYSCLRRALEIPSAEVICVAVNTYRLTEEETAIGVALTPLMERVQFSCQDHSSVGLVLMDEERKEDKALREYFRQGSPHLNYDRIVDTLSFIPSEESAGIQIADLIAGGFARHMNYGDSGYLRTFLKSAANKKGKIDGRGMKVYHRADTFHLPAERGKENWSDTDREVHEYEFSALEGGSLSWTPQGGPIRFWRMDWDCPKDY